MGRARHRRARREELGVVDAVEHDPDLGRHLRQRVVELGVDEEDRRPGVLDDVVDLVGVEAEVDGHEDATEAAHAEERDQEAGRVRADEGDAFPGPDAHGIEGEGHPPGPGVHLGVGDGARAPATPGSSTMAALVGMDQGSSLEEPTDGEWYSHGPSLAWLRGPA